VKIEKIKIDTLKPDPANARQHNKRNIETIQKSLTEFGQRKPLVVWQDTVIAGNGTLQAATALGWTDIEITRVPDNWTPDQIAAYSVADNRTSDLAEWDEQALLDILAELSEPSLVEASGFVDDEIDDLRALLEETEPEITHPTNVDLKPTYSDLLERYAERATRQLVVAYPSHLFVWVSERLGKLRIERDFESNSQAIVYLIEQYTNEEAPSWEITET
jgi:hypothetical protein